MSPEVYIDLFQQTLFTVLILVTAAIVPGLIVGLMVAVFQAATSINEQTLSFLPRLLVTLIALMVGGHWGLRILMEFFRSMVEQIPMVIG